jgi:hypothetical protein
VNNLPNKNYYERHREEMKARARAHHFANREKRLKQMQEYRAQNRDVIIQKGREYYQRNNEELKRRKRVASSFKGPLLRRAALERLGGKCVRCGFSDWRALQIDHIEGGGAKEFQHMGSYAVHQLILAIPENELRRKYQCLCANCNWIKKYENKEDRSSEKVLNILDKIRRDRTWLNTS